MLAVTCLALAIYYEAGSDVYIDKLATGWAVVNSADMNNKTICREVFSGHYYGVSITYMQRDNGQVSSKNKLWQQAYKVAISIMDGKVGDPTGGATNFECDNPKVCKVLPPWAIGMEYRGKFGHQFFFKRY